MFLLLTSLNIFASVLLVNGSGEPSPIFSYQCSFCEAAVDEYFKQNKALPSTRTFRGMCQKLFPESPDLCEIFLPEPISHFLDAENRHDDPNIVCQRASYCSKEIEPWEKFKYVESDRTNLDVRVSKAMGSRGYNFIRLSVVSDHVINSPYFTYNQQFLYRWTTNPDTGKPNILNTGIVPITPGSQNVFTIEGTNVTVQIPKKSDGIRGVILADPCFQSRWVICKYQIEYDTFNRTTEFLNAAMGQSDTQFFQILGDNFYDKTGGATATFFKALSLTTKSKVFGAQPGNHDLWIAGAPGAQIPQDQRGNGFMQFYGQDTLASVGKDAAFPYNFSANPDNSSRLDWNLPPANDFFFYHQLGNVAFFGFNNADSFYSQVRYFAEACEWATQEQPDAILLVGHWSTGNDGCNNVSSVPAVYTELSNIPQCASLLPKMRYFYGHRHCNQMTVSNVGFNVGGLGMSDCGDYGFTVLDTTNGTFNVYYFLINSSSGSDNFAPVVDCIKEKGVSGCYDLAIKWSSVPLTVS